MLTRLLLLAIFAAQTGASGGINTAFDGYAFGMSVADAERVAPVRKSFECGRLMTSRCIVYERRLGALDANVTVQFSLEDRRLDRIELAPRTQSDSSAACEAQWQSLVDFLQVTYGSPQLREGNTVRWHSATLEIAATVLIAEGEICSIQAALTPAVAAQ